MAKRRTLPARTSDKQRSAERFPPLPAYWGEWFNDRLRRWAEKGSTRAKNRAAGLRRGADLRAKSQDLDARIRDGYLAYRDRHPYDRSTSSTTALAKKLAKDLQKSEHTVRRKLMRLGLK